MVETGPFQTPIGENATLHKGDMRLIQDENEYDAVITDPPYYDNIIYSEVADYFYVWQKLLLEGKYDGFDEEKTPRVESIVTNPYLEKSSEDFESDLHEAFTVINNALKRKEAGADKDGILAFTYHHSDAESWGELLASLCEAGFEVSATYPVSADLKKFISGDAVSFDIIVVARPAGDRKPISWQRLKPRIYDKARKTRERLEQTRQLSRGDIGVMEMGVCFREYSKHHGEVRRDGDIMDAKDVVDEIYGIIQEASDVGVIDVYIDLLNTEDPTFDDVMKLCRGTNASPEELREMKLFNTEDGFELGTYENERRQAYIRDRVQDDQDKLTDLDKLQFLRYLFNQNENPDWYLNAWNVSEDESLNELAERLANASDDDTYRRVLGEHNVFEY
jgi:hypothetical protein